MAIEKKLEFFNNVSGFLTILYGLIISVVTLIFKDKLPETVTYSVPLIIISAIILIIGTKIMEYVKERSLVMEKINKRIDKLEEQMNCIEKLKQMEVKLIKQDILIEQMINKKAMSDKFFVISLIILFVLFILWYIYFLYTA